MTGGPTEPGESIVHAGSGMIEDAGTVTRYRRPLVGFAEAQDPRFQNLPRVRVDDADHIMPQDLVPGARPIVSFFIPFDPTVVKANARDRKTVAYE